MNGGRPVVPPGVTTTLLGDGSVGDPSWPMPALSIDHVTLRPGRGLLLASNVVATSVALFPPPAVALADVGLIDTLDARTGVTLTVT